MKKTLSVVLAVLLLAAATILTACEDKAQTEATEPAAQSVTEASVPEPATDARIIEDTEPETSDVTEAEPTEAEPEEDEDADYTADDAAENLKYFLGDDNLTVNYQETVTVFDYGTDMDYFKFEVLKDGEFVDYYYVIDSRYGGGIYNSADFDEKFNEENDYSGEDIDVENYTADQAAEDLMAYLGNEEGLSVIYIDTVTVQQDGEDVEYYKFDIRNRTGENSSSHMDYYYLHTKHANGGLFNSAEFLEHYGVE